MQSHNTCGICFNRLATNVTSCGHEYCHTCFTTWFIHLNRRTCPACRTIQATNLQATNSQITNFVAIIVECHTPTLTDNSIKGNNFLIGHLIRRTLLSWTIDNAVCMQRDGKIYPCKPSSKTIYVRDIPTFYHIL